MFTDKQTKIAAMMRFQIVVSAILVLFLGSALMPGRADEVPYDENRYEATVLAEGMPRPLELDVAPDGRVFFIELDGLVRIFDPAAGQVVEAGSLDVFNGQENGLIGLALDPHFAENQWIYLVYSPREGYVGQYVSRFTMDGNQMLTETEKIILKIPEHRDDCCHHAGSIEFGPDGNLFITTGDNTHPGGDSQGYAPIDEREGRHVYDAQDSSGNTMDLRGKILRIKPHSDGHYTIPAGNLFPPGGPIKGLPEIYVMGCRNPWRMNVDQKTGYVYWGEVGPDAGGDGVKGPRGYDEINQARQAGFFGWPFFIGNNRPYVDFDYATGTPGATYDPENPINSSPTNTGSRILPKPSPAFIYYPYGESAEFPMMGTGGRTACAGPVYHFDPDLDRPLRLPEHLDNCLIIFDWQRTFIKVVRLDENSDIVSIEPFLTEIPIRRPVDMTIGPDGSLYVLDYGETWGVNEDSRLLRIDYHRHNRPPQATLTASAMVGKAPLKVEFSAAGSSDKDSADQLAFTWRIEGKEFSTGQTPATVHTFEEAGNYDVLVTVDDGHSHPAQQSMRIVVGNDPPVVKILNPPHGSFFEWGESIQMSVGVRDYEDGNSQENAQLIGPRVLWNSLIQPAAPEQVIQSAKEGHGGSGLTMIQHSDCLNCHALDRRVIGPAFLEIAGKYKGDAEAMDNAARRIIHGSSKVWGEIPMLPHAQFSMDEARDMVGWIFSLAEKNESSGPAAMQGLATEYQIAKPEWAAASGSGGSMVINATYTDLGAGDISSLTSSDSIHIRHRRVEAEFFSAKHGTQVLPSTNASGGKIIGSISSGHYLVFKDVLLSGIKSISAQVASPHATGGIVELRAQSANGPLIGKFSFDGTGGWENWVVKDLPVPAGFSGEIQDLYCIFINPTGAGSAFMNLDYLEFNK